MPIPCAANSSSRAAYSARSFSNAAGPPPGEAWADARLFQLLDLAPGDRITVGERTFPLTRVVVLEPDAAVTCSRLRRA